MLVIWECPICVPGQHKNAPGWKSRFSNLPSENDESECNLNWNTISKREEAWNENYYIPLSKNFWMFWKYHFHFYELMLSSTVKTRLHTFEFLWNDTSFARILRLALFFSCKERVEVVTFMVEKFVWLYMLLNAICDGNKGKLSNFKFVTFRLFRGCAFKVPRKFFPNFLF